MALSKRSSELDLMPPPPPPKRIKRAAKVLDEDTYTAALAHIIKRDFFPGLLETDVQDEYLDAVRSGDQDWIDEAGLRVQQAMTPGPRRSEASTPNTGQPAASTPRTWAGDTPIRDPPQQTPLRRTVGTAPTTQKLEQAVDLSLSLNDFQARYTSEDNESFNSILDKQNARRREKYSWIWNKNKLPSKQQNAQALVQDARAQRLLAAQANAKAAGDRAVVLRDRSPPPADADDRPAMIDAATRPRDPRNGLMFQPDDLEDKFPQHKSRGELAQDASRAAAKGVNYANTRMPYDAPGAGPAGTADASSIPASPSISAIDAAINARPHPSLQRGGAYAASDAPGTSEVAGNETPRVNGYAFVDEDPTAAELASVQHGVDHGAILASIRASHGADDTAAGPNPFSIASSSRRETLHHALVERNSAAKRAGARASAGSETPVARGERLAALKALGRTPRGGEGKGKGKDEAAGALTPAARSLYEKLGRTPRSEGGVSGRGAKKGDWTPTPLRKK